MFERLDDSPEDALHAVMARYQADHRTDKIDLGVGVYREANGKSPIMRCVAEAQQSLMELESSKAYIGLRGDERFIAGISELLLGASAKQQIASIQSVGGTGGIRLALELARSINSNLSVIVGTPSWPNHFGICDELGIRCQRFNYYDRNKQAANIEQCYAALQLAKAGDIFVLHGPCHNPTGTDLPSADLFALIRAAGEKGVVPLIDAAYYGLGNDLDDDLSQLRQYLELAPEVLLVISCSKAFGLYRERTGVLFVGCSGVTEARRAQSKLEILARANYSMPPSHGAAVAGLILENPALSLSWCEELAAMRQRIMDLRQELAAGSSIYPALAAVPHQKGIFSLLPLSSEQVNVLARQEGIYLAESGRINIAGFKSGDIERFFSALARVQ